jgi:hypothetical protein
MARRLPIEQIARTALDAAKAARVRRVPEPETEGDRRRAALGRDPDFLAALRKAKQFYEERGIAVPEPTETP